MVKQLNDRRTSRHRWTLHRWLRLIAGTVVLVSLALSLLNSYWLLLTAFVGLNLLQSAFTNWCPMMTILRWLGVPESEQVG